MKFAILLKSPLSTEQCLPNAWKFIKKRLQQRCFPVKFTKFLKMRILKNICERLLLKISTSMREIIPEFFYPIVLVSLYKSSSAAVRTDQWYI